LHCSSGLRLKNYAVIHLREMINNNKLENIIRANKDKFLIWNTIFHSYRNVLSNEPDHQTKIKEELFWNSFTVFSELLIFFTQIRSYKDEWEKPTYRVQLSGINANIKSIKTGCEYSFGYYEGIFFLDSFINNPNYIHKVSDEFWLNILSLNKYGELKFDENHSAPVINDINIEKKYSTKSNLFKIIRNYLFLDLTDSVLMDLGNLEVTWSEKTYWDELMRKGCFAFELLYKINYELWKINKNTHSIKKGV
jgi:hypothetical protein